MENFDITKINLPKVTGAGFFVSKGIGKHPERIINDYEIIFVRRGKLYIEENSIPYVVHGGQVIILEPGLVHRGIENYEDNLNFYWVHFVLPKNFDKINIPKIIKVKEPEKLTLIFRELSSVWQENKLSELRGGAEICRIVDELMKKDEVNNNHINYSLAVKIDNFIKSHLDNSRTDIGIALDYNPDYLGRVYFATYKRTITQNIHKYRVEEAKIKLSETFKTVEKIAYEVGFNDVTYFRRVFKEYTGVSPKEYRHKFSPVFEINS